MPLGKIINVQGSPSEGFIHEFERNHDLSTETRNHSLKLLCKVDKGMILENDDEYSIDDVPQDQLEELARGVNAPGPSLRPAGSTSKTRIKIENCQTWLTQFVSLMVEKGVFPEEALVEMERAPRN
ncbi:hypothetical protein HYALB_00012624 [Hymenoscyphus albidus]|uniref:Uncharacterized protein n=1 Tax=Hymenoscyphus albidus TaxID=595503 RepID=A0A9N9LWN7_9HELO|nr:hypothetical protein HYALB_00012624 [Hymenoscyphus albidus]